MGDQLEEDLRSQGSTLEVEAELAETWSQISGSF